MITQSLREFAPVRGASVTQSIVQAVARMAIEGKIAHGQKLPPEGELAKTWGVARSSVREAFRVFQILGVTEAKPGRGTVLINNAPLFALIDWSHYTKPELIPDIAAARLVLEPAITAMAARNATAETLRAIEATIEAGKNALGDMEASIQAALDFHTAVAAAANNETLLLTTRLLRSLYLEAARLTRRETENYGKLLDDHIAIFNAIKARDPIAAAKAAEAHMKHGIRIVFGDEAEKTFGELKK